MNLYHTYFPFKSKSTYYISNPLIMFRRKYKDKFSFPFVLFHMNLESRPSKVAIRDFVIYFTDTA